MKNMSTVPMPVSILAAVVVGGAAFFGGVKFDQYQVAKQPAAQAGQFGGGQGGPGGRQGGAGGQFQRGNRMGFRPVSGEITSSDDTSITVKLQDGSSKIVLLSDKTAINKASEATKSELKVGQKVAVFGTDNPDGSVSAQNIQLNPLQNMMRDLRSSATPSAQPK